MFHDEKTYDSVKLTFMSSEEMNDYMSMCHHLRRINLKKAAKKSGATIEYAIEVAQRWDQHLEELQKAFETL